MKYIFAIDSIIYFIQHWYFNIRASIDKVLTINPLTHTYYRISGYINTIPVILEKAQLSHLGTSWVKWNWVWARYWPRPVYLWPGPTPSMARQDIVKTVGQLVLIKKVWIFHFVESFSIWLETNLCLYSPGGSLAI